MNTIVLEDNIEYAIIKELDINNNTYTLFANVNNPEDICYRKTIEKDNKTFYVKLDSENELELVNNCFAKEILKENS